jgi:hypothetical protein
MRPTPSGCTSVIQELRIWRKEDLKFEPTLGYIPSLRPAGATEKTLSQRQNSHFFETEVSLTLINLTCVPITQN